MQRGKVCCWLTGPSGAGTSTIAARLVTELTERGQPAAVIDDADVDRYLTSDDRLGAVIWLAGRLVSCDAVAVVAIDAPDRASRDRARRELEPLGGFAEIFVDPSMLPDEYEEPYGPELRVPTHDRDETASTAQVISWLERRGALGPTSVR